MTDYAIKVNGQTTDIATLYEHRIPGDPSIANTGYQWSDGKDAAEMFVPLKYGSESPVVTDMFAMGKDFRELFARKGSVSRFLQPLPWDRTIQEVPAATIYRQLGRNLMSYVTVTTRINQHGKVEIVLRKPHADSNPGQYIEEVLYTLEQPPAWDETFAPQGVPFEVRYDAVGQNSVTLSGGMQLGQWYAMDTSRPDTTATATLEYNHTTQGPGHYNFNTSLKISVRRSDYPDTNKAEATQEITLRTDVVAEVFSATNGWLQAFEISDPAGVHDPDRHSQDRVAVLRYMFTSDGFAEATSHYTGQPWAQRVRGRWRRDGLGVTVDDYELKIVPANLGAGITVANSAVNWTTIPASGVGIDVTKTLSNHTLPGQYRSKLDIGFFIRQKSTKNFVQGGVALPDNFINPSVEHQFLIALADPPKFPWPSPAAWTGTFSVTYEAHRVPEDTTPLKHRMSITLNPDGSFLMNDCTGVFKTGRWCPNGVQPNEVEVSASHVVTAGHHGSNPLTNWSKITSPTVIWMETQRSQQLTEGTSTDEMMGSLLLRRATFHKDTMSAVMNFRPSVRSLEPIRPTFPSLAPGNLVVHHTKQMVSGHAIAGITFEVGFSGPGNRLQITATKFGGSSTTTQTLVDSPFLPFANDPNYEFQVSITGDTFSDPSGLQLRFKPGTFTGAVTTRTVRENVVGITEHNWNFQVDVRRKAYPAHNARYVWNMKAVAEITPDPHTLVPASDFTRWAGTWNHNFTNTY